MTAIAAIAHGGKIWIGGDSAGVGGLSLHIRKDPKVFVKGEFLIGYTSSFRMGQLLRYYLSPARPKEGQGEFEYMVCDFVPAIRSIFKEHGYLRVKDSQDAGGTFLIGWRGKLFEIFDDFQVAELLTPFNACGCGVDLALGSLHSTEQYNISPRDRIELALSAAEAFSAGVRRPFVILEK